MVAILQEVVQTVAIAASAIVVEELLRTVISRAAKSAGAESTVLRDIGTGMRLIAAVVIVSDVLQVTGLASYFTLLTLSGIGALVVTLALQTTLSNVIAGVLLFTDGATRLHDQVEYSGVKGEIVRMALRNTWIKTESGTLVVVGNSSLSNGPLSNHTATTRLSKRYAIK